MSLIMNKITDGFLVGLRHNCAQPCLRSLRTVILMEHIHQNLYEQCETLKYINYWYIIPQISEYNLPCQRTLQLEYLRKKFLHDVCF
jgi:hypothetical protein